MASQSLHVNHAVGRDSDQQLARKLGWFSIGLGAADILAAGSIAKISGALDSQRSRTMIRSYGAHSKTLQKATSCSATSRTTARGSSSNRSSVGSSKQLRGRAVHVGPS